MEAYRIEHLSFTYPEAERNVLERIDLSIEAGEFVTICGKSGSGKSTLLRQLKTVLTPHGRKKGNILFFGEPLEKMEIYRQASEIGYVLQNPDNQIVTDKVWHELAFGLESLGYNSKIIRLRVAEMASFFGIQTWFHKKVSELSGGQKQILNLAAIMAMQPSVLILDEPTSMLDPIAATEFLETIKRINRELGITIIMSEHRLEEVIPITDRLIVMDEGQVIADGSPSVVGETLFALDHPMFLAMPTSMQLTKGIDPHMQCLVTINEARKWLTASMDGKEIHRERLPNKSFECTKDKVFQLTDVWFRYDKHLPNVIKDLSFDVHEGEFYCIVGGNGTGKSTTLSLMSGIHQPYRGKILLHGKRLSKLSSKERFTNNLAVLPQNPQNLFVKKTLELDLHEVLSTTSLTKEERGEKIEEIVKLTELDDLLSMHPYDLSGGEQQRAALAKILLLDPKIILLDEPTKGLDAFFKERLAKILNKLLQKKVTIVMVSHDVEFCAKHAHKCALFFDGHIVTENLTRTFFAGNSFYTTAANRIARHLSPDAVIVEDVVELCRQS